MKVTCTGEQHQGENRPRQEMTRLSVYRLALVHTKWRDKLQEIKTLTIVSTVYIVNLVADQPNTHTPSAAT